MSLRLKIVAALVLLATCATAAVGISSYISTRHELNEVVDRSLQDAAANPTSTAAVLRSRTRSWANGGFGVDNDADSPVGAPPPRVFDAVLAQFITTDGTVVLSPQSGELAGRRRRPRHRQWLGDGHWSAARRDHRGRAVPHADHSPSRASVRCRWHVRRARPSGRSM